MTNDQPERPHVHVAWVDPKGNHRDVDISGPQGFVSFWLRHLASTAFEVEPPPARTEPPKQ